jgi:hypothetical protein
MKIAIAIPHNGTLKASTARCLAEMMFATGAASIIYNDTETKPEVQILTLGGSGELTWKRTALAMEAQKSGADYLLWIDSDQTFSSDALLRLMAHDKAIVAGNYQSRSQPHGTAFDLDGEPVPLRSGLEEVGAVGLGFCLMKVPIFRKIPQPWFAIAITPEGKLDWTEDVHFCSQARNAGLQIFVDHDLEVGHVAETLLTLHREDVDARSVLPTAGTR